MQYILSYVVAIGYLLLNDNLNSLPCFCFFLMFRLNSALH